MMSNTVYITEQVHVVTVGDDAITCVVRDVVYVGAPAGGSTGQVLSKATGDDYDVAWAAPGGITDLAQLPQDGATDTQAIIWNNGLGEWEAADQSGGGTSLPVVDTTAIVKGSADVTKQVKFEADGLTTGNTRVVTVPDADGTIEYTGHTHTVSEVTDFDTEVDTNTSVAANTTHSTGDGSDHADVGTNTTHSTGDGSDHADVGTNTTHSTGDGSDHANVATNTTHISSDGSDHSDVGANTTHSTGSGSDHADVATNTTHSGGDGSDHADVGDNTTARHTRQHALTGASDHTATANKVLYSDNSSVITELALGSNGTYLRSNGPAAVPTFTTPGGSGDVVGPASATADAICLYNSTTGKLIKDSVVTVDGSGNITTAGTVDGIDIGTEVAANTTHSTGDGSDHSDVGDNTTHSTGDGSDHADVDSNSTHRTTTTGNPHQISVNDLSDAVITDVANDDILAYDSGGDFINQSAAEAGLAVSGHNHDGAYAALANGVTNGDDHDHVSGDGAQIDHLNCGNIGTNAHSAIDTHVDGDGSDHGDVADNTTHSGGDGSDHANVATNTTHITSDGTNHGYINQDVQSSAAPSFAKVQTTEIEYGGNITLDATNAGADSVIYITNSDGSYVADLDVDGDIVVAGTVDGIDIATDVAANTSARHTRQHALTGASDHTATANKVLYSDNSSVITELALGADGEYLMSNGPAVAPTFETPSGTGDVVGPAGATADAICLYNSTTGKLIKDSVVTVDGSGNITTAGTVDGVDVSGHVTDTTTHGTTGDIVGTSDDQTLTTKTIDADSNTISNLEHGSEVDNPTTAHGATGAVMGTTNTQVVTNKDLTATTNLRLLRAGITVADPEVKRVGVFHAWRNSTLKFVRAGAIGGTNITWNLDIVQSGNDLTDGGTDVFSSDEVTAPGTDETYPAAQAFNVVDIDAGETLCLDISAVNGSVTNLFLDCEISED